MKNKKARDKKATKELYERLDKLTLDDIRKEYLHPLEEEEMISNGEIGELIKTLREDSHLKQDNLAKAIGVSKAAVSQWETEKVLNREYIFNFQII